jgi:large conductance mechanosensitive channel
MLQGFKNFLMRGDVIIVAVGLSVALGLSNLVKAFTDDIINPLIAAAQGTVKGPGLGWQLVSGGGDGTYLNLGALISAIIYFIIFMAVVYFLIVAPYKYVMARMGKTVFGEPPPTKTCPACLSDRPESRRNEVQALRRGYRQSRRLTKAGFRPCALTRHTATQRSRRLGEGGEGATLCVLCKPLVFRVGSRTVTQCPPEDSTR